MHAMPVVVWSTMHASKTHLFLLPLSDADLLLGLCLAVKPGLARQFRVCAEAGLLRPIAGWLGLVLGIARGREMLHQVGKAGVWQLRLALLDLCPGGKRRPGLEQFE